MLGKQKCRILKEIRQKIADENDIPYVTRECSFKGECRGTCPRCESELRYLEQQLALRASLGKRVAVAALCATMSLGAAACSAPFGAERGGDRLGDMEEDLSGMIASAPAETPEPDIEIVTGEAVCPVEEDPLNKSVDETAPPQESAEPQYVEVQLTGDVWYPQGNANG